MSAIDVKYAQLGSSRGLLGAPKTDEQVCPDGIGHYRHYKGGSIYWHPKTGAHEVHGSICAKWASHGWERSFLGYPTTDETSTPDGIGRFNHFQHGSVYWTPETGAQEIHGAIRAKWSELGWERSSLGYPISDELAMPGSVGRYSKFQRGLICWNPVQGAWVTKDLPKPVKASEIIAKELKELPDADLNEVADELTHMLVLAAQKVVANSVNPGKYPLPDDRNSFEQIISKRFKRFKPEKRRIIAERNLPAITQYWREFNQPFDRFPADLSKKQSIQLQLKSTLNQKLKRIDWKRIATAFNFGEGEYVVGPHASEARGLEYQIRYVVCTQETNEPGTDSIDLGAIAIDVDATVEEIPAFRVGEFSQHHPNNVVAYNPLLSIARFDLGKGKDWPRTYFVTFILAEIDWGTFPDWLNTLCQEARKYAKEAIEAEYGSLAAMVANYVMGKFIEWLAIAWQDDVFQPITVECHLPSPSARFPGGSADNPLVLKWSNHGGEYWLTLNLHISGTDQVLYNGVFNKSALKQVVARDLKRAELIGKHLYDLYPKRFRLTHLQAYYVNGEEFFNAIWDPGAHKQCYFLNLSKDRFRAKNNELMNENFRLHRMQAHMRDGVVLYNGIWNESDKPQMMMLELTREDFLAAAGQLEAQGSHLVHLQAHIQGGQELFNAIWNHGAVKQHVVVGWIRQDFMAENSRATGEGFHLTQVQAYVLNGLELFNGIWEYGAQPKGLVIGYSAKDFQAMYDEQENAGFRLFSMNSYQI